MNTELLPRYSRVKRMITERIDSGEWQPRHRIPSESELVRDLGVSRMTINRALRELTSEGFLIRMQGVGTFVAEAKAHTALLEVHNIADEIAARGHRHSSKILELKARPASEEEAAALGIQPGQRLFYSQIVHYENDVPVQVEDRCVNPLVAPDYLKQDFDRVTPYTYLTQAAPLTAGANRVLAETSGTGVGGQFAIGALLGIAGFQLSMGFRQPEQGIVDRENSMTRAHVEPKPVGWLSESPRGKARTQNNRTERSSDSKRAQPSTERKTTEMAPPAAQKPDAGTVRAEIEP